LVPQLTNIKMTPRDPSYLLHRRESEATEM
jgi:hypothetical protein